MHASSVIYTVVPATRGHCRFGAKVSPRGRWSLVAGIDILTHIYGHTYIAHIVYALLMHTQTRYESNENREIPIIYITTVQCTLHGINGHRKSTTVCKCSDNLFQANVHIKCNLDRSHTHPHARTPRNKHGVRLRWVARTRSPDWRDEWLGDNSTDLRLPAGAAKLYSDFST